MLDAARAAERPALRLHLHRRRDLRRGRRPAAAAAGVGADRADVPLRAEQARRRGLPGALRAPLRPLGAEPAPRQRLRPAPGPARRGRGDRDLLRQAAARAGGRPSSATASRPATTYMWATWSTRGAGRGGVGGDRPDQRRHRDRDRRARARRPPRRARRRRASSPSSPRPARARCSGSRSIRRAPPASSAGRPRSASPTACGSRWTRSADRRSAVTTLYPCPPRPTPARSASASSARGSATSPACATCWRRPSTSPA